MGIQENRGGGGGNGRRDRKGREMEFLKGGTQD